MVQLFGSSHIFLTWLDKQFHITQLKCNHSQMGIHEKCLVLVKHMILNNLIAEETFASEILSTDTAT